MASCGYPPHDPIDDIVEKESANPGFRTGMYFKAIPDTQPLSPEAVAARAVHQPLTNVFILETKEVVIPMKGFEDVPFIHNYTAVLLRDKSRRFVVLTQHYSTEQRWLFRRYEVK
jgi:hypothetical protein